jgi:hypothetical protein
MYTWLSILDQEEIVRVELYIGLFGLVYLGVYHLDSVLLGEPLF